MRLKIILIILLSTITFGQSQFLYMYGDDAAEPDVPYLYYKFVVTVWNTIGVVGSGEIALYDNVSDTGNVGIGNGQLDINGSSGTATADCEGAGAEAFRAADGNNTTTRWLCNGDPGWWLFQFDELPTNPIVAYTVWSPNAGDRMMNTFTLQGSQNGTDYDILDSREGVTATLAYEARNFIIGVPGTGE